MASLIDSVLTVNTSRQEPLSSSLLVTLIFHGIFPDTNVRKVGKVGKVG
ncbi:hypothetical protein [Microseira sp. BLCC-F43]